MTKQERLRKAKREWAIERTAKRLGVTKEKAESIVNINRYRVNVDLVFHGLCGLRKDKRRVI